MKDAKGSQQSPKSIDYVDALPLTPVGKPDKKAVRSRVLERHGTVGVVTPDRAVDHAAVDQPGGSADPPTSSNSVVNGTTLPLSNSLRITLRLNRRL